MKARHENPRDLLSLGLQERCKKDTPCPQRQELSLCLLLHETLQYVNTNQNRVELSKFFKKKKLSKFGRRKHGKRIVRLHVSNSKTNLLKKGNLKDKTQNEQSHIRWDFHSSCCSFSTDQPDSEQELIFTYMSDACQSKQ